MAWPQSKLNVAVKHACRNNWCTWTGEPSWRSTAYETNVVAATNKKWIGNASWDMQKFRVERGKLRGYHVWRTFLSETLWYSDWWQNNGNWKWTNIDPAYTSGLSDLSSSVERRVFNVRTTDVTFSKLLSNWQWASTNDWRFIKIYRAFKNTPDFNRSGIIVLDEFRSCLSFNLRRINYRSNINRKYR